MGFQIEPTQYHLQFEDPRLNGLTVLANSVSIGEFMEITGMSAREVVGGVTLRDDVVPHDSLLAAYADVLVSWDLDDAAGQPVPANYDGLAAQEPWVVRALIKAWMEAVSGVTPPLPDGSASPGSLPESSLPMEVSSPGPES